MVMCMLVIVAPPIVMGAWSMAFLLGQHVEYYLIMMCHMHKIDQVDWRRVSTCLFLDTCNCSST